jgi:hypothetical protein
MLFNQVFESLHRYLSDNVFDYHIMFYSGSTDKTNVSLVIHYRKTYNSETRIMEISLPIRHDSFLEEKLAAHIKKSFDKEGIKWE